VLCLLTFWLVLPAAAARAVPLLVVNAHIYTKYGNEPGVLFYTHISDQYARFIRR
jgi:TnpA family transposase